MLPDTITVNLTGNRCWNKSTAGEGTVKEGVSAKGDYRLGDGWAESSLVHAFHARAKVSTKGTAGQSLPVKTFRRRMPMRSVIAPKSYHVLSKLWISLMT